MLLASNGQRPGFPINILHYTGQALTTKNGTAPNVNSAKVKIV